MRDFGEDSNTARQVVPALCQAIHATPNPKAQTLFRQWQHQFREVSGYDPASGQLNPAEVQAIADREEIYAMLERSYRRR